MIYFYRKEGLWDETQSKDEAQHRFFACSGHVVQLDDNRVGHGARTRSWQQQHYRY